MGTRTGMGNRVKCLSTPRSLLHEHEISAGNQLIEECLRQEKGNGAAVARRLGVTRMAISARARAFNLQPYNHQGPGRPKKETD